MFYLRTFMLSLLLLASAVAAFAQVDKAVAPLDTITISVSAQGLRFSALSGVGELRLEVFNSLGETVFTQLTSEAETDWNLRAGDGEPLAAGLYSYVLTLKSGEETTREHRGNLIIERDRQQVWLTAQDGATVSGTFTRSGERSLAGFRTLEDQPVRRDVSGREVVVEKLPDSNNSSGKAVKQEKAALTGTANKVAKFDATGLPANVMDSAIIETGGRVGIGTTTPQGALHVVSSEVNPLSVEMSGVPGAALTAQMDNFGGGGGTGGSGFLGRAANGSKVAPTNVAAGERLGFNVFGGYAGGGFRHVAAINAFVGTGTISATSLPSFLNFMTTPDGSVARLERFRIDQNGNVGIGTTTPQVKLDVAGDLQVSGNAVVSGNIAAKYQDVAEWVPTRQPLVAGTVVSLDATRNNSVVPSARAYDTHVAGVVSAQPGVILGEGGEGKALVATTGRVKVKVDASRRPIKIGDLLVTSGKSGLAMKSQPINLGGSRGGVRLHRPGTIIGKALEPLAKGRGEILVLLSLQ